MFVSCNQLYFCLFPKARWTRPKCSCSNTLMKSAIIYITSHNHNPLHALLIHPQSRMLSSLASILKFVFGSSYFSEILSPAGFDIQMYLPSGKKHLNWDDGYGQGQNFGASTQIPVSGHKYLLHCVLSIRFS